MINIRQEAKIVIELEGEQIQSFVKFIAALYELNNPSNFGFKLKKPIKFDADVDELIEEFAHSFDLVQAEDIQEE